MLVSAKTASAVELITNGGFESGTAFLGWTISNPANGFHNWANTGSGQGGDDCGGCSYALPAATQVIEGSKNAWNGLTAGANQSYTMFQQVTIPAGNIAILRWSDKYQANYTTYCSSTNCGQAQYFVEITNTSNVVLQTLYTQVTLDDTNTNTGWVNHTANLSAYGGQTIRLRFRTLVTVSMAAPAQVEIDGVSLSAMLPSAAEVTVGGRVMNAKGSGISGAQISLTGPAGNVRTAVTSPLGYYQFDGVEAGHTYVIVASKKGYSFSDNPRLISVGEESANVDFMSP